MSDVIQDTCVSLSVHTFLEVKHMYEFLIDNIFIMFGGCGLFHTGASQEKRKEASSIL